MAEKTPKSYYERETQVDENGLTYRGRPEDLEKQCEVATKFSKKYHKDVYPFIPRYSPIDYYFASNEKIEGLLEVKSCSRAATEVGRAILNMRKYRALTTWAQAMKIKKPIFAVRFTDSIYLINVNRLDPNDAVMGGCSRRVTSNNDVEPVIYVPIEDMKKLDNG